MNGIKHVEEKTLKQGDINLKLVVNLSHGHMRFMDYRVGKYPEKRDALDRLAGNLGLHKVFTLVEKQDSQNWRAVGFSREGIYPSFFRTADAYVMSRLYGSSGEPLPVASPLKPQSNELIQFPERKLRKPEGLRIDLIKDEQSRVSLLAGLNGELRHLPFGRVGAPDVVFHARAQKRQGWFCAEIDDSFGFATVGFAPIPTQEADLVLTAYAGNSLISALIERGVSNLYGLSPSMDRWSNEVFAGLGFKVTGRLADHLRVPEGFATTLIWHRRIGSRIPAEPPMLH